jgi:hypothetical protein
VSSERACLGPPLDHLNPGMALANLPARAGAEVPDPRTLFPMRHCEQRTSNGCALPRRPLLGIAPPLNQ